MHTMLLYRPIAAPFPASNGLAEQLAGSAFSCPPHGRLPDSQNNAAVGADPSQATASTGVNNSATHDTLYICPTMPEDPVSIGYPEDVQKRCDYRMALRPDRNKYVTVTFRVMRRDAEMHVGLILSSGLVKRSQLYTPKMLDRWTRTLRIKIKALVKIATVFRSISARLGFQKVVGLKYCLDGFYGVEAFGDAFGNYGTGICPWMEVTSDGTPLSLGLEDGDNIYISLTTEKMIELARLRGEQMSEVSKKQANRRSMRISKLSVQTLREHMQDERQQQQQQLDPERQSMSLSQFVVKRESTEAVPIEGIAEIEASRAAPQD